MSVEIVAAMRLALLLALLLAAAAPAMAVDPSADDGDGDGVADAADACPDTPTGDLIDQSGCSVCPCDASVSGDTWSSHGGYVRCVLQESRQRVQDHVATKRAMRAAVRAARRSTCGSSALTRCCVYADDAADVGTCKMMSPDACDQLSDQVDAEDEGSGSCLPNPCTF